MKTSMNFTTSIYDAERFTDAGDLRQFYRGFGLDGLELMPLEPGLPVQITPDMVVGVHLHCPPDWMETDRTELIETYREDLAFAKQMGASYVVFHASQISMEEALVYTFSHSDEEVVTACCDLVNALMDGQDYTFEFLLENLWWRGLTFLRPEIAGALLDGIHYPKTGFMLDTGHLMNTNWNLATPDEAVAYIHSVLDKNEQYLPKIRGIHLNQSLSGSYVREYLKRPPFDRSDYDAWVYHVYDHIFHIDQHRPFVAEGVKELVKRIDPAFVTYEYITNDREQLTQYLQDGVLDIQVLH